MDRVFKATHVRASDLDMVIFTSLEKAAQVAKLKEAFADSDLPFRVDVFVWREVP